MVALEIEADVNILGSEFKFIVIKIFLAILVVVATFCFILGMRFARTKEVKVKTRTVITQSQTTYQFKHAAPRFAMTAPQVSEFDIMD